MVIEQLKKTLVCASVIKNQHESLVTLDFENKSRRSSLMRLCFSALAAWPLVLFLIAVAVNPWRYHLSLTQFLGMDHFISQFLFDLNFKTVAILVILFFSLALGLRKEGILTGFLGLLITQGDLHLSLGIILLSGIFLARHLFNLTLVRSLCDYTKTVWTAASVLSFLSWVIGTLLCFEIYQFLLQLGLYSKSMHAFRIESFILFVAIYYFLEIFILSLWGHFHFQRNLETTYYNIKYSSALILHRLTLGRLFKNALKQQILSLQQTKSVYSQKDLDLLPNRLVALHQKEESFLTRAVTALT